MVTGSPETGFANWSVALHVGRFGKPAPGTRVFLVTRQQQNGWESDDQQTNAIVPDKPEGSQAAAAAAEPGSP